MEYIRKIKKRRTALLLVLTVQVISVVNILAKDTTYTHVGEKILAYYADDSLKRKAAEFLIKNMPGKYGYEDELINRYDTLFALYERLQEEGEFDPDAALVEQCWWHLVDTYGHLDPLYLGRRYDTEVVSAEYLIDEIETAFEAWTTSPDFISRDFDLFCRYVLPYRIGNEPLEPYRRRHFEQFRKIRDSLIINDDRLIKELYHEFDRVRRYKNSKLMWRYPISMPRSKVEQARRGSCRHMSEYYVLTLRACGIPATIDFVNHWGNRSQGHEWVVVLKDSGEFLPFDALDRKRYLFTYKPAKIFRQTFEIQNIDHDAIEYVPGYLLAPDRMDVSHLYFPAFDIDVTGYDAVTEKYASYPYGVICVFDNKEWQPIDYGKACDGRFYFKNMIGDICYMAGYYDNEMFVPATPPFILDKEGKIRYITPDEEAYVDMHLTRKYPKFTRITSFSKGLLDASVEVSDSSDFSSSQTLMTILKRDAQDIVDSALSVERPYRYVRLKVGDNQEGNLAEIIFYGRKNGSGEEQTLNGIPYGFPDNDNGTSWREAVDGDCSTYLKKSRKKDGYIALDLGENTPYILTRVRYIPRSDTNFIIPGNHYRLEYWDGFMWQYVGEQTATDYYLDFQKVPAGRLYILHNLSEGIEERIFTYEEDKQQWW